MNPNQAIIVFIAGTLVLLLLSFSLVLFLVVYKRKQQMHLSEKLSLEHKYEQELLRSRLEVQEQSFKYFSEEIHDNVGQVLTLCKLQLHQLASFNSEQQSAELIQQSTELISKAISDLRSISHTLNGNFVGRLGLKEALEKELNYIKSGKKVAASLELSGDFCPLPQEKELLVFRIIQEALANIIKHAAAKSIQINLNYQEKFLTITIADDGIGFDQERLDSEPGLGLDNIRTRSRLLNGSLNIISKINQGTTLTLQIPLKYEQSEKHENSHSR